jgi:hypothetical protein
MSIIIPGKPVPSDQKLKVAWDVGKIHPTLREDLAINQKVIPIYIASVVRSVQESLNHPDTKPRVLTKDIVNERIALAHDLLLNMRQEHLWALRRCCDVLPEKLLDVLRRGEKVEDVVEEAGDRPVWVRDGGRPQEAYVVDEIEDPQEAEGSVPKEVEDAFEKDNS